MLNYKSIFQNISSRYDKKYLIVSCYKVVKDYNSKNFCKQMLNIQNLLKNLSLYKIKVKDL